MEFANTKSIMMELSNKEIERYSRQLILSSWSEEKQLVLKNARIALNSRLRSAAYYLAAAGAENLCLFADGAQNLGARLLKLNSSLKLTCEFELASKYDFAISILPHDVSALKSAKIDTHFQIEKTVSNSIVILKNTTLFYELLGETDSLAELKAGALISAAILAQLK